MFAVCINENMHDVSIWLEEADPKTGDLERGLSGWERVWSWHQTSEEAAAALAEAREYVRGRSL